jgi:hypothetical protein
LIRSNLKICRLSYKQESSKSKAKENYEKFLTLWKDANPGIAEVEEARESLAGFK